MYWTSFVAGRLGRRRVFINYRREDTGQYAGRLRDRLVQSFGAQNVFMDLEAIDPGQNFQTAITNAIASCDVFLIIIGKSWSSIGHGSASRLHDPADYVKAEIVTAIKNNVRLIPVVVGEAALPRTEDLPTELSPILERQAFYIPDALFHLASQELAKRIARMTPERGDSGRNDGVLMRNKISGAWVASCAVLIGAVIAFSFYEKMRINEAADQPATPSAEVRKGHAAGPEGTGTPIAVGIVFDSTNSIGPAGLDQFRLTVKDIFSGLPRPARYTIASVAPAILDKGDLGATNYLALQLIDSIELAPPSSQSCIAEAMSVVASVLREDHSAKSRRLYVLSDMKEDCNKSTQIPDVAIDFTDIAIYLILPRPPQDDFNAASDRVAVWQGFLSHRGVVSGSLHVSVGGVDSR